MKQIELFTTIKRFQTLLGWLFMVILDTMEQIQAKMFLPKIIPVMSGFWKPPFFSGGEPTVGATSHHASPRV